MVMNFDKSFFEQIHQLIRTTPYQNLIGSSDNITNNALYTNYTADLKNCYFLFNASRISDGYYSTDISESEWCVDCLSGKSIQHSYECVGCEDIHSCFWCQYMTNCRDCHACNGLQGCHNCLACINLSHKKYHVLNHEVSEKEYTSIL